MSNPWHYNFAQDLRRHFAQVTIGDLLLAEIARADVADFNRTIAKIKSNIKTFGDVYHGLKLFVKLQHGMRKKIKLIKHVEDNFTPPAELIEAGGGGLSIWDDPHISWYAYYVDLFAAEYGWTIAEINKIPFAAINEFVLAIEHRHVSLSARAAAENNLNSESVKILTTYPRRKIDIPVGVQLDVWRAEMKKKFD